MRAALSLTLAPKAFRSPAVSRAGDPAPTQAYQRHSMAKVSNRSKSAQLAQRIAAVCLDNKAEDVVILDLAGVSDMTDFFVIASGTSDTHVRSTAEHVMEILKSEGNPVHHNEGVPQGRWVLLDFVDVVVHLFHPALRNFYQLERLWGDAAVVPVASQGASV